MRILTIVCVLLAGIAGLLMSVCGGYFLLANVWQSVRSMYEGNGSGPDSSVLAMIAAPFLIFGGALCWVCFRFVMRRLSNRK